MTHLRGLHLWLKVYLAQKSKSLDVWTVRALVKYPSEQGLAQA